MPTRICGLYSYKGGAGRTVSTANLAAVLAFEMGLTVVCIDMDLEGAGLGVVFNVHKKLSDNNRLCVQDIFGPERIKSPADFRTNWWPRLHFDISSEMGLSDCSGALYLIPAAFAARTVEWTDQMERTLAQLIRNIEEQIKPDIILIDSASGLQDWACLTFECCQTLLAFFRWNRQFVEGTIRLVQFLRNSDITPDMIFLVPSAVPAIAKGSMRYSNLLESGERRLRMETGADNSSHVQIHPGIPEAVGLKWDERILCIADDLEMDERATLDRFRQLARSLVK